MTSLASIPKAVSSENILLSNNIRYYKKKSFVKLEKTIYQKTMLRYQDCIKIKVIRSK